MRCFVSIELPGNVKTHIWEAFEDLRRSRLVVGPFVRKENLHLTLKFLGNVSKEKIGEIKSALAKIDFRKFPIETGKVMFFPNERYVKTICVELVSHEIEDLKEAIENSLSKLGFELDDRFNPHLTIARVKGIRDRKSFEHLLKNLSLPKLFFIAEGFSLMKSSLTKKGPQYEELENFNMLLRA